MLLLILIVIVGIILWKTDNAKMRKVVTYTAIGLVTVTFLHTALQFNTSQKNSVSVKSEGVIEENINNHQHQKEQYTP